MYCIRSAARLGQRLSPSLRNITTSASLRVRKSENFTFDWDEVSQRVSVRCEVHPLTILHWSG